MKLSTMVVVIITALGVSNGAGAESFVPTPMEVLRLPPYCRVKMSGSPEERRAWRERIGPGWEDIHHFCFAINFFHRSMSAQNLQDRRFELRRVINNTNYMLKHSPPSFPLMPAVYLYKGRALARLGRMGEAAAAFEKAIQIRPDYTPPYAELSDIYRTEGDKKKAADILREGLKHAHGSSLLRSRLEVLTKKAR